MVDDRDRSGDDNLGEEFDVFTGDPLDALFDLDESGDDVGTGPGDATEPDSAPRRDRLEELDSFADVAPEEDPYAALSSLSDEPDDFDPNEFSPVVPGAGLPQQGEDEPEDGYPGDVDADDETVIDGMPAVTDPDASPQAPSSAPHSGDDRYAWLYDESVKPPSTLADRYAPYREDASSSDPTSTSSGETRRPETSPPPPHDEPAEVPPRPVDDDPEPIADVPPADPDDETRIFEPAGLSDDLDQWEASAMDDVSDADDDEAGDHEAEDGPALDATSDAVEAESPVSDQPAASFDDAFWDDATVVADEVFAPQGMVSDVDADEDRPPTEAGEPEAADTDPAAPGVDADTGHGVTDDLFADPDELATEIAAAGALPVALGSESDDPTPGSDAPSDDAPVDLDSFDEESWGPLHEAEDLEGIEALAAEEEAASAEIMGLVPAVEDDPEDEPVGPLAIEEAAAPPETDWEDFTGEHYVGSSTQEYLGLAEELTRTEEEPSEQSAVAAGIPGVDTGLLSLDDVVDGDPVTPLPEAPRTDLGLRVLTGLALLALFGASLMWQPAVAALATIVLLLSAGELYMVLITHRHRPIPTFGLLGVAGCLIGTWMWGLGAVPVALVATLVAVALQFAMRNTTPPPRLSDAALTVLVVAWIGGLGAFALPIVTAEEYRWLIGAVVVIVAVLDIGQYFAGRRFGKRQLAPVVSPKKTVEGLVGGAIGALIVGALIGVVGPFSMVTSLALAASAVALGPLGDLAVSLVKRILGVKDMGTVLPGHGGILDRIDALLFVLPAAWVVFSAAGLLT